MTAGVIKIDLIYVCISCSERDWAKVTSNIYFKGYRFYQCQASWLCFQGQNAIYMNICHLKEVFCSSHLRRVKHN
jgi:hypothetical protein